MRNRILFIGSIIFASQVVFAETLVVLPQPPQMSVQQSSLFEREIASSLVSRGLEPQAAERFAKESVSDAGDALLLTQLLASKTGIESKKIFEHIATQSLFEKTTDLREYDDVVAMVHKIKGASINSDDLLAVKEYIAIV